MLKRSKLGFLFVFFAIAAVALFAAACGDDEETAGTPRAGATTPSAPREVFSFDMPWSQYNLILASLPAQVAIDKGFFEQEGLKPNILTTRGGGDTLQALLSTGAPMAMMSPGAEINAINQGQKLKIIWQSNKGGIVPLQGIVFCVKANSPVRSIQDLKGKKIAFTRPGSNTERLAKIMVQRAGLSESDATFISAGGIPEGVVLLDQGQVDVSTCAPEILATKKYNAGEWRPLWTAQDGYPGFVENWMVVKEDFARQNPDRVKAFFRAIQKAVDWIDKNKNSEELVQIAAKLFRIPAEDLSALRTRLKDYTDKAKQVWPLELDRQGLEASVRLSVDTGELDKLPDSYDRYIDTSFARP
ncbi:MAG TPA: ABC transporter substrate-binding protein [Dehalococcoidia bacterium]|nr:ABC transporter substrate-binding protein [Dehalococcoidia bacterium]